jgi:type II secretory pathway pseudopilin PulG
MTLVETLIGLAILGTMIFATVTMTTTSLNLTKNNVNKEFATQKAISMLEELRSLVQVNTGSTLTFLDVYDDGTVNKTVLTTQGQVPTQITQPGDAISGNTLQSNGKWLYERRISVRPVPGQGNDVRFVNVKVYINEKSGQRLLAEVASVLRTLIGPMPATQVYDVYAIAIENVPGWWVYMSNIVPFVRSTVGDLESRNPGLQFRMHWINTLSYGRDMQYKPYINIDDPATTASDDNASTNTIPWAYFYPGSMPSGSAAPYYYPGFLFRGVMNQDGTNTAGNQTYMDSHTINGYDVDTNPWPYAIADQYNNAMRYEDELAYYNLRKAANPNEELTWRLLLEQMYSNPGAFTNAIVINLHGELLPFPPIRNYSDAAKDPEARPGVRAVTHPEQLRYTNTDAQCGGVAGCSNVKLRVYTYLTNPDAAGDEYLGQSGGGNVPVTIKISGTNSWNPAAGSIQMIRGGTDQDGVAGADAYDAAPQTAPTTSSASNRMYYTASLSGTDTIIKLYNSPLKHKQLVDGGGGLNPSSRLYGQEYIPSPLEDLTVTNTAGQFATRHLGSTVGTTMKTVRDYFNTTALNNNDGSMNWSTNWIESNDNGNASSGRITIGTGSQLRVGDNTTAGFSMIERQVDLSSFTSAVLNFRYGTNGADAGSDKWAVSISSDGGSSWFKLAVYDGTVSGDFQEDITPYLSSTTRIRFEITNSYTTSSEYFWIDNLQIEGSRNGDLPKNTARWIITIPSASITNNNRLTVETRIGDTTSTGVMYPTASVPPNLSRTYVWKGTDTWIFGDGTNANLPNLPLTERFQFIGDPRHCPYADLKRPHIGSGFGASFENALGMGYNRYFDDLESAVDADGDGLADDNVAVAEIVATKAEPYDTTGITTFAVRVDGGAAISVNLAGSSQTASAIANTLNANATFSAKAVADSWSSRLRIRSKKRDHTASVQYDNLTGNNGAIFGFEGGSPSYHSTGNAWPGWQYNDAGGNSFGVKNDGNLDNDTWRKGNEANNAGGTGLTASYEIDVHRAYQILRSGISQSMALWTTMTGFSYYYLGIGNEIGYDAANNFTNSIPVSTMPFTGVTGTRNEQNIIPANCDAPGCGVKYVRAQNGSWWSLPWLGELYPDSQYAAGSNWKQNGNLIAGTGATRYIRDVRENYPDQRGSALQKTWRRSGPAGCTTVFWGETAASSFHHVGNDNNANILAAGTDIANNYSLPVPSSIPSNRPWRLDWNSSNDNPESYLAGGYAGANKLQLLQRYFERPDASSSIPRESSSLVALTEPIRGRPAFVVVNGLSPTGITGTVFIAKWSFLSLIQSYFNGGVYSDSKTYSDPDGAGPLPTPAPGNTFRIRQLPRVKITDPNPNTNLRNPSSVTVGWSEEWKRWDGQPYSSAYVGAYTPDFTMKYIVMYSKSNGSPDPTNGSDSGWWYWDGTPVPSLGARDLTKAVPSGLSYVLNTPSSTFPEGTYLFRVEGYRVGYPLHYSFHQYRGYIER